MCWLVVLRRSTACSKVRPPQSAGPSRLPGRSAADATAVTVSAVMGPALSAPQRCRSTPCSPRASCGVTHQTHHNLCFALFAVVTVAKRGQQTGVPCEIRRGEVTQHERPLAQGRAARVALIRDGRRRRHSIAAYNASASFASICRVGPRLVGASVSYVLSQRNL